MTRNLCTKQQDNEKSGFHTPHTALNRCICRFVSGTIYSGILNTLSFQLQPRTESSNTSNTLELHTILLTHDLGTLACMNNQRTTSPYKKIGLDVM